MLSPLSLEFLITAVRRFLSVGVCAALLATAQFAVAEFGGLTRVGAGMNRPAFAVSAPGDPDHIFVLTTPGPIHVVNTQTRSVRPTPFLDLTDEKLAGGEGGVLGMAFHPDYESNGKFYVYLTVPNDVTLPNGSPSPFSSQIREYTVSSNPYESNTTYREILTWERPTNIHVAGWIDFNPVVNPGDPQYLYVATGDGGVGANAQLLDNLFGKILRIDIDGDDFPADEGRNYAIPADNPFVGQAAAEETFVYGLRNPWRNSFDPVTGDLWIGDVGQARREEINLVPAGVSGLNFGWNRVEGSLPMSGQPAPGDIPPFYEYAHFGQSDTPELQGNAVVGGYVYRGPDPDEYGLYFFGDNIADGLWSFDPADPYGTVRKRDDLTGDIGTVNDLVSLGSDGHGNLYALDFHGEVFRFEPGSLRGDYNNDGVVDAADYTVWRDNEGAAAGTLVNDPTGESIGAAQYQAWADLYGYALLHSSLSVPECGCVTMVLAGGVVASLRRRFAHN